MRTHNAEIALIAVLVAGCGGGSGDESNVSANPPASPPAAATPAPETAPAPPAAQVPDAPAVQGPVTSPEPPGPAPAPSPAAPPEDGPLVAGPAPIGAISGEVLRAALSTRFMAGSPDPETANPLAIGSLEGDPTDLAHVGQSLIDSRREEPPVTYYSQVSGQFANNNLTNVAIGVSWLDQVLGSTVSAGSGPYSTTLTRSAPVALTDDNGPYQLDTTLAHWEAAPWFVQLQIKSDARSEAMFQLCLHYRLPDAVRLSCGLFDRGTAQHRGVYLVDDFDVLGAKTWRTH